MKIKRMLVTSLLIAMFISAPAYAADSTYSGDGNHEMIISATVESTYSVKIPASLTLSYNEVSGNFEGTYNVGVKGNILLTKKVVVAPSASFTLTNATTTKTSTGTMTQAITDFVMTDEEGCVKINPDSFSTTSGSASINLQDAGNYSGTVAFSFMLKDK